MFGCKKKYKREKKMRERVQENKREIKEKEFYIILYKEILLLYNNKFHISY